jgi:hypothetical protein
MSIATDHALATIASILAPPGDAQETTTPAQSEAPEVASRPAAEPAGYFKAGPGPMAELRFKWTVRHGDDGYYVDETVGAGSVPVVNGPMTGEAAIQFADDRARKAQECFQALKNEMAGRGPAAPTLASRRVEQMSAIAAALGNPS